MSKFGDIINVNVPVLISFYTEWSDQSQVMKSVLQSIANALEEKVVVVRIDVDKNKDLAEALKILGLPTHMIYKRGQMIWRQSGIVSYEDLVYMMTSEFSE